MRLAHLIALCSIFLFGIQCILASEPDVVFRSFEEDHSEVDYSLHSRSLEQAIYKICMSFSCSSTESLVGDEDSINYYIILNPQSKMVLDIRVGKPKMSFSIALDSDGGGLFTHVPVLTRTNIKVNPSSSWPSNVLPTKSGSNWQTTLNIPSSSSLSRYLRFEIENIGIYTTTVAFTVKSSVSQGDDDDDSSPKSTMIIAIAVAVAGFLLIAGLCTCYRARRNRRLRMERLAQADTTNLSHIDLNTSSFVQPAYASEGIPVYPQQPYQNYSMYSPQPQYSVQPMQFGHPIPQYYPGYPTSPYPQVKEAQVQPIQTQPIQIQPNQTQPAPVQPLQIVIQAPTV